MAATVRVPLPECVEDTQAGHLRGESSTRSMLNARMAQTSSRFEHEALLKAMSACVMFVAAA